MAPVVDLTALRNVVGKYAGEHNIVVAAGSFTAAAITRMFITKNKLVTKAMFLSGGWLAIQETGGASLKLMHEQFGYLISLLQGFRG